MSDQSRTRVVFERLRWILVLPLAVVTGAAMHLLINLLLAIVSVSLLLAKGIELTYVADILLFHYLIYVMSTWPLAAVGFVFGGAITAPKCRIHVAIILLIIATIFNTVFGFMGLENLNEPSVTQLFALRYIIGILGSVGVVGLLYTLKNRKLNYKVLISILLIIVFLIVGFLLVFMSAMRFLNELQI